MDPRDRLDAGREAAARGDYARALEDYLWFHHHALEDRPSLAGVRLSFALSYWKDLAAVYPPAGDALVSVRDAKVALLRRGEGGFEAFHDITSLNHYLDTGRASYDLLLELRASHRQLVNDFSTLASDVALQFGDLVVAREYMPEPSHMLERWQMLLNMDPSLAGSPMAHEEFLDADCRRIARGVTDAMRILRGSGESVEADSLPGRLLAAIQDPRIRERLAAAIAAAA